MRNLKSEILSLRASGHSYRQIESILGCSKSLVSYYLSEDQRIKSNHRSKIYKRKNAVATKLKRFQAAQCNLLGKLKSKKTENIRKTIVSKRYDFLKFGGEMENDRFDIDQAIYAIGDSPKCYLTGEPIDLSNSSQYSFDHKVPRSRGGDNSLSNLGICLWEANRSKNDMTIDEYISLCKKVLEHNGYDVSKRNKSDSNEG